MSCGSLEYLEGGTLKSVTIINSQIVNSSVSNSELESCTIKTLAGLDTPSAKVIADAIAKLSPEQLAAIAKALLSAAGVFPNVSAPAVSNSSELPTKLYGSRSAALGNPDVWMQIGGYAIPGFIR